jgi:hypothetical protein
MSLSLAMVALGDRPHVSGAAMVRDLAATRPGLPAATGLEQKDGTLAFSIGDALVAIGLMPAPIPWTDLEGPCATSWLWPKATEELKQHRQHLIVTVMADRLNPIERAKLLTQVVASILATCPQAIGVYWGDATLVIPRQLFHDFAVEMPPDGLPLVLWIDFRVGPGDNGQMAGFTTGMKALGHMELETLNSPETPGDLRERLIDLCGYLLANGPVIQDGHTVGQNESERIQVIYSPSSFGHEGRVMRLDYSNADSGKPWWKFW